jgi:hypothetical protein
MQIEGNIDTFAVQNAENQIHIYEAYSESVYHFAVKKIDKVSYKILLLSGSTFLKLFFDIFTAIIEALIVAGHNSLYTLLIECSRR